MAREINELEKELYSFSIEVERDVKEETVSVDEETKEETKVTRTVKKKVPVTFRIMRPTRKQIDSADLEYSKHLNLMMKEGLLTKAMVIKKYADTGGMLTEEESAKLLSMQKKLADNMLVFLDLSTNKNRTDEQDEQLTAVTQEINQLRNDLALIESSYSHLFQHTADMKATIHAILWYTLMLTKVSKDVVDEEGNETGEVEWVDFFEGSTFAEKQEDFFDKEDNDDELYALSRKKLSYFISYWYNGAVADRNDFIELEKEIDENKV